MLKTRVLSAVLGLPLVLAVIYFKGYALYIFALMLSLFGLYEYYNAMEKVNIESLKCYGYIITILFYIFVMLPNNSLYISALLCLSIIIILTFEILYRNHSIVNIAVTIFGFLYISLLFSHLIYIEKLRYGMVLLWLPFLTAWLCDTSAYFVGVNFGKKKLCPSISPKKTLEGAIGGVIGSTISSAVFGFCANYFGYNISIIHFIIAGFLCGIVSQLGDLSASYIKRFAGIKDFSNIIPGHGGILDRFDSVLFTAPIIFYYFSFFA